MYWVRYYSSMLKHNLMYLVEDFNSYWIPQLVNHCSDNIAFISCHNFGGSSSKSSLSICWVRIVSTSCNDFGSLWQKMQSKIWLKNTKLNNQKSLWLLQDAYPRGMLRGFCLQLRMIWILHIYHLTSSNNKKKIHKCADITDHGLSSYLVLSIDIVSVCIFSMKSKLIYLEHNYSC